MYNINYDETIASKEDMINRVMQYRNYEIKTEFYN